jgi:hypothetical protein
MEMAESVSKRGSEREKTESPPLPLLLEVPKRAATDSTTAELGEASLTDRTQPEEKREGNS